MELFRFGNAAVDATKVEGVYVDVERIMARVPKQSPATIYRVIIGTTTGGRHVAGLYERKEQAIPAMRECAKRIEDLTQP